MVTGTWVSRRLIVRLSVDRAGQIVTPLLAIIGLYMVVNGP